MSIRSEIDRIRDGIAAAYTAVSERGGTIPETQTCGGLAEAIRSIPGGAPVLPPDPAEVYRAARPADWISMPEPGENEIYLLVHIPNGASSLLAFTATCTGSYVVETGEAGAEGFQPLTSTQCVSGTVFETELNASEFGHPTGTGMRQALVRISGQGLQSWETAVHSKKTSPTNYKSWNIVEISCRMSSGTGVRCGNSTDADSLGCLRFFTWRGANNLTDASKMFNFCRALTAVVELDTSLTENMSSMFGNCTALAAVPQLETECAVNMSSMFSGCAGLTAVPQTDTAKVTNMSGMFSGCSALTAAPLLNTASVTNMDRMFYACGAITAVPELNMGKTASTSRTFYNCYHLGSVTLNPETTGWAGTNLELARCSLNRGALAALFNSLPVITGGKRLDVSGNPGLSELTEEELALPQSRGWILYT